VLSSDREEALLREDMRRELVQRLLARVAGGG
jgi:outer membrane lipopolysaccharide assembly protein LptE/RlpB